MTTTSKPGATSDLAELAGTLAIALVVGSVVAGIVAAAVSDYTVGQLIHDVALLVLGLAALVYAYRRRPESAPYTGTSYSRTSASLDDPPL